MKIALSQDGQFHYDYLNDTHCRAFCMAIAQGLKEACNEQNGLGISEDQKSSESEIKPASKSSAILSTPSVDSVA